MDMSREARAELIRITQNMQDELDRLREILLPDNDGAADVCPHPPERVVDDSTMEDDGELYRCTLCGETRKQPFYTTTSERAS